MVSTRADIITRRTYSRPLVDGGNEFETWDDTCQRVITHQCWLWERALTHKEYPEIPLHDLADDMKEWVQLNSEQLEELHELYNLIYQRKLLPAGRTLWLGGTDVSKKREASMFNCSHTNVETVYDVVDCFWLLLQGCGVGFTPIVGTLTGFRKPMPEIEIVRSTRSIKGRENNEETFEEKFSFRLSRLNVFITIGVTAIILIVITTFLIAFTPLREYIPGYTDVTLTKRVNELKRLTDSLETDFRQKSIYIQNIKNIIDGKGIVDDTLMNDNQDDSYDNIQYTRSKEDSILRQEYENETSYDLYYDESEELSTVASPISSFNFFIPLKGIITS